MLLNEKLGIPSALIGLAAGVAPLRFKLGVIMVIAGSAPAGLAWPSARGVL